MLRIIGSALALVAVISLVPLAPSEAGDRNERYRIVKHNKFKMTQRSDHRHHRNVVRVVNRNVVVVKVNGKHRHHYHRPADTYSGDVVIDVRNGVGQWSYGSYGGDVASVSVAVVPKAKIIDVGTLKTNGACEMQAGVCVIRP